MDNLIPLEQRNKIQRRDSVHEQAVYLFQSYLKEQSGFENGNRFSHSNDIHNKGRYQYSPGTGNSIRNNSRCNHQNFTSGSYSKKDYYGPNRDPSQISTGGSLAQNNDYETTRYRKRQPNCFRHSTNTNNSKRPIQGISIENGWKKNPIEFNEKHSIKHQIGWGSSKKTFPTSIGWKQTSASNTTSSNHASHRQDKKLLAHNASMKSPEEINSSSNTSSASHSDVIVIPARGNHNKEDTSESSNHLSLVGVPLEGAPHDGNHQKEASKYRICLTDEISISYSHADVSFYANIVLDLTNY